MKRKAQSEIITTILLILIVLAAVVVVWMVISRFLKAPTAECSEVRLSIARVDTTANTVTVTRAGGTGTTITVSDVAVSVDGTVTKLGAGIQPIESKPITSSQDIVTGSKIEVAPIVTTAEGTSVTCSVTDKMTAA